METRQMYMLAAQEIGAALGIMGFALIVGCIAFFCAFQDYDWFMNNRKMALVSSIFGRSIARIIYMLLGLAFIGGGLFLGVATLLGK